MSRHEGVSCDSCLKGNFRGKRYKCLICYDYDLCATCYDAGATTTRHTTEHPMQCILTRADFDLFYGGEGVTVEQPQAYICPFCSKMGFNETTLQEHVTADHAENSVEVVCPICAALPGGDPNHVTDDFSAHLALEHRAPREFDEPMGGIRHVRRIPHPGRGGSRARRSNMHFQAPGNTLANLSPSGNREAMDPIAELLSQLTSVRSRAAAAQSVSAQLQNLEMQLQNTRQQLERLPRRQTDTQKANNAVAAGATGTAPIASLDYAVAAASSGKTTSGNSNSSTSQFLLSRCSEVSMTEMERQAVEVDEADRSIFVQELLLSSLAEGLRLSRDAVPPNGSPPNVGSVDNSDGSDSDRPVGEGRKGDNPHNKMSSQGKPKLSKPVTNHKKVEREPPPATNH